MNEVYPLGPLARRWSRRSPLSEDDRKALLSLPFTRKTYGKDAYIVREGEHPTESAVLPQGIAFRQKLLRDGARQIISFHVPTEFVDLQNSLLGTADHSMQSLNRAVPATIPRSALIQRTGKSLAALDWDGLCEVGDFDELYQHQRGLSGGDPQICFRPVAR